MVKTPPTNSDAVESQQALPLSGVRIIEFCHMIMGPTCGMVLADLGADVIKVEPKRGDTTRRLVHQGAGFFVTCNRNKRSLVLDVDTAAGLAVAHRLIAGADVLIENLRPGAMAKKGLDYGSLREENPGLIYCSLKGFLSGPYSHRTALDEVVQMMGGLAYMTGPEGRPLRAGASVTDILGGVYGATGILAALRQRELTGQGQAITSALFESTVHLVAQHMMQFAVTDEPVGPMPDRPRAWAVYDVFKSKDGEDVFIGIVSDTQWRTFCEAMGLENLLTDPELATNETRHQARDTLLPRLQSIFGDMGKEKLMRVCEDIGLPFAPINQPQDLFDDRHLNESGGFGNIQMPDGRQTRIPLLPLEFDGHRLPVRLDPPLAGEQSREILREIGLGCGEIDELFSSGTAFETERATVRPDGASSPLN